MRFNLPIRFAMTLLLCLGLVACGGGTKPASTSSTTTQTQAAALTSITVIATPTSVPAGQTGQVTAGGVYSDGTKKDITSTVVWSSSDTSVATVSTSGLVTGLKSGTVTVIATCGTASANVSLTVAPPVLTAVTVTPAAVTTPAGTTLQLSATGTYSDKSTKDLTSAVSWSSSDSSVASISQAGLLAALKPGATSVAVASGALNAVMPVTVGAAALSRVVLAPATASVAAGLSQNFIAYGYYTDGSSQDISAKATWTSSDPTIASTNGSLAAGVKTGAATISASSGGIVGTAAFTVTAAALQQLDVFPDLPGIDIGGDLQFTATGTYSDGSTGSLIAGWSSTSPAIATIDAGNGLAKGVAAGATDIHATVGSVNDTTTLTVYPATLATIVVTPSNPSLAKGTAQPFIATGTFTDGSTQALTSATWSSDQPTLLAIDPATGVATALAPGIAQVTVTAGAVTGATTVTVTNATLQSLAITPANASVGIGGTVQYAAVGTFSDNSTEDLTSAVNWNSSNGQVAIVSAAGMATGLAQGTTTIAADFGTVSANTVLTITSATLQSIDVQPNAPVMVPHTRLQLHAIGIFTDGTTRQLAGVSWSSSKPRFASANGSGMLRSKKPGTTTIRATLGSVVGTELVTVTGSPLTSIAILPSTATVTAGTSQQFTATGTFSDGSTSDITLAMRWTTSDFTTATVNSSGVATGVKAGTVTVTATYGGISSTATLNVN